MTELTNKSALELAAGLKSGEFSSVEVTQSHLDRISATEDDFNSFITVTDELALETAKAVDAKRSAGEDLHALAGVPVALKDLVVTEGVATTAGSKMLENWVPPYESTVHNKVKAAGLPVLGKTNLDEFAMGSTTEHSAFGNTRNPWNLEHVPGGSSGGAAAALAGFQAPLSVGTDTGGSVRQPAAFTGTVGVKPTYGSISRFGIIAMASSLDQVGPMGRNVADAAALHELLAGHDPLDSTSLPDEVGGFLNAAQTSDLKGKKLGVIKQLAGEGYQDGVRTAFTAALETAAAAGAEIVEVDCPSISYALDAYYLIMPSEVSSNLARYDGMRYGLRVEPESGPVTAETVMSATRAAGFGDEVKRRIILGTYALSAGYYDAYYGSAQKIRTLVQNDFAKAFAACDVLVSPTTPTTALKFGAEKAADPMALYLGDVATIPANLAGIPGLSLPAGLADGLPVGFQILAPAREDIKLYEVAGPLEAALESAGGRVLDTLAEGLNAK
ncbi:MULTISPECIES: Asp-tRNA(Asn)/Glu-tRNA(Gln) amidotransferase subunit GatA [Brevibacterium]|jgi:aspartyl-tRNA(Asn)/glutamyl-tRNA(Gln) amidotransferase subunit A|uniref:Glutamyl-tRNA(Gln) amidotransferase subunit A n=2 Tax=Brevibacterium TaxID=1696 RepID=A0A142NNV0_BRELN|nr:MULTISPECIES: Asp-tRNA(Asn)/Glu-tRNA(Gln) amidotransferase subunit GatA [Brevibacterium]AMT94468.1 aspartyl/glutamyl-tRNA amidotransferase subunit A [Brevibacterium linens]HJE77508.1 Asp-tRNA(Asn)/Glu-tRNA(Gln) amidotransferase subunit GatA [Brevibacterium epidermidis]